MGTLSQPYEFTMTFSICCHGAAINKNHEGRNFADTVFHAYEDNKM